MATRKPRVLVVEDDTTIRVAVAASLRGEGYEVVVKPDGSDIEDALSEVRPDVVVLDVRLPAGPNGYELGRTLRQRSSAPLLFLTAADTLDERLRGFEVGGDDYLAKPFDIPELLARVRALLRRTGRLLSGVRRQVGDVVVDEPSRTATRAGRHLDLTPTEFELLAALVRHPEQILSKSQLLTQVWGFEGYDPNLVEVHMSSLRHKLEAEGPRLIHTVRGVGYVARP